MWDYMKQGRCIFRALLYRRSVRCRLPPDGGLIVLARGAVHPRCPVHNYHSTWPETGAATNSVGPKKRELSLCLLVVCVAKATLMDYCSNWITCRIDI